MSSVGILGGTFDPPHYGHLLLGECARAQFALDRVIYIPAGQPYHKADRQVSAAADRLAMTRLAVDGNPGFAVDELEVRRDGPTYTIDTLEELHRRGLRDLLLILGTDALAGLSGWKDAARIPALATIAIAPKGHSAGEVAALASAAGLLAPPVVVDMPPIELSGTAIRARVKAGKPIRYFMPDPVVDYVLSHGLYR